MEYRANVNLEYKDFLNWIKVHSKTSKKVFYIVTNILIILATIAMAVGMCMLIYFDAVDTEMIFLFVVFLVCLTYLLFKKRMNAKISQKMFVKNMGTMYFEINDEGIFVKSFKAEEKYFFSGITAVYTNGDTYFTLLDKNHALILPKRSFTEGDPDNFADFLYEKTGHKVEYIKC